jgi:hypothetical protein
VSVAIWQDIAHRPVQRGHKPDDGRYQGGFSDCLGLLRSFDCVPAGDFVELYRRNNKFHNRLGIFPICSQRK